MLVLNFGKDIKSFQVFGMFLFCFVCYVTKIDVDETDKTDNSLFVTVSSQTSNCHLKCFEVNKLLRNTSITFLFAIKSVRNCGNLSLTPSTCSSCCKILSNIYSWAGFLLGLSNVLHRNTTDVSNICFNCQSRH